MSYDANSIETLDFVTAIRKRIEMYMGSADNQGILQCIREVISNSIDEFSIGYGNQIDITIDTSINKFTCRDYARSIPFGKRDDGTEAMIATIMLPHTGGKFSDKQYGNAVIGQNGIGIKGVALSAEKFKAISYRDKQQATLIIENGQQKEYKVEPSKERNGTYIEFIPSASVYRLEAPKISFDDVCKMCEDWSYLNKGLKFILTDIVNNKTITYYSKDGISDFIRAKVSSTIQKEPYIYSVEDNEGNKIEIGFLWGSKHEMSYVFTNGLHNLNGGTSLTGAKTAITRTMNNLSGGKYNGDFVRDNLCYVINAKVPHASFSDQTKMRVNNGPLKPLADKAFTEGLKEFSKTHPEEFEKMAADEEFILTLTSAGYGKRTSAYEYRITSRGTQGVTNIKTDEGKRAADVIASMPVKAGDHLMLVTDGGQLIRTRVDDIRIAGRATMGVIVFRLGKDEKVVSATCVADMGDEETENDENVSASEALVEQGEQQEKSNEN